MRSLLIAACLFVTAAGIGPTAAQTIRDRLAVADPDKGATVFKKCRACHTLEDGGPHGVGPNLWGVIGRPVASADGYGRYSQSMKDFGGVWEVERLDAYLEKPKALVPKGIMSFPGLPRPEDRANVIAFLNRNRPNPESFGAASGVGGREPAADSGAAIAAVGPGHGRLVDAPGVAETFAYCTPCHSEIIVAQQGKTREGWAKLLTLMTEEQGMAEITDPDRSIVLDYLAANYNTDRPNFPRH